MEIFAVAKNLFKLLGYYQFNCRYGRFLCICLRITCFSSTVYLVILSVLYIAWDATTFAEVSEASVATLGGLINFALYLILIWKKTDLRDLFKALQIGIQDRMFELIVKCWI